MNNVRIKSDIDFQDETVHYLFILPVMIYRPHSGNVSADKLLEGIPRATGSGTCQTSLPNTGVPNENTFNNLDVRTIDIFMTSDLQPQCHPGRQQVTNLLTQTYLAQSHLLIFSVKQVNCGENLNTLVLLGLYIYIFYINVRILACCKPIKI